MIPVIIVEEHHEAFLCWKYFIDKGYIKNEGNYLLHIDHHDDMEMGGYEWDFSQEIEDEETLKTFVYERLGIADFIMPALYYQIFDHVHILKNTLPKAIEEQEMFVRCNDNSILKNGSYVPFLHAEYKKKEDRSYAFYTYLNGGLGETHFCENVVLDIDLDYFCWDDSLQSVPMKKIEITRQAYEEYMENPYHPFRILPRQLFRGREIDGRYYLIYQEYNGKYSLPTKERMEKRMDVLLEWIDRSGISPAAIDICRSRYSGYLNNDSFPWIEESFIKKLKEKMDIEVKYINSL